MSPITPSSRYQPQKAVGSAGGASKAVGLCGVIGFSGCCGLGGRRPTFLMAYIRARQKKAGPSGSPCWQPHADRSHSTDLSLPTRNVGAPYARAK